MLLKLTVAGDTPGSEGCRRWIDGEGKEGISHSCRDETEQRPADSESLQSDYDFYTELLIASKTRFSPHIVSLLGFASDRKSAATQSILSTIETSSVPSHSCNLLCTQI
ncbi:hypothetical protein AKJ16_DCAP17026 [Drosera capensis]